MPTKPDTQLTAATLVDIRALSVHFDLGGSTMARLLGRSTGTVKAVDGINLTVGDGEVVGVVGESGSGKSTLGRSLLGLAPATSGAIDFKGTDVASLRGKALREHRQNVQMIFQDPNAALNPAMTVEQAVADPLRIHGMKSATARRAQVVEALERVGLSPVELFMNKYPRDLSGGQKQRVVIARAIIMGPTLLVADEPISMLDMSVRAKILQLMLNLQQELGLSYLYITHDLASAKFFCDRIAIMYLGRIVELGPTDEIFDNPKHPYTQALLAAIPDPDPDRSVPRNLLKGEIPDAARPPHGCSFHPRCPQAFDKCGWESRDLVAALEGHWLKTAAATYDAEASRISNLEDLMTQEPGPVVVKPSPQSSPEQLKTLLDEVRADTPDARIWSGVASTATSSDGVTVDFVEGEDPQLRKSDNVEVACHLY